MDRRARNDAIPRAVLHNIAVVAVGFVVAFIGRRLDQAVHARPLRSSFGHCVGLLSLAIGFLLRTWATAYFYENRMKVVVLQPQGTLVTSGPFSLSRKPALSRRQRLRLLRRIARSWFADGTHCDRPALAPRRQDDQARRTAARRAIRQRVARLREQGSTMAVNMTPRRCRFRDPKW